MTKVEAQKSDLGASEPPTKWSRRRPSPLLLGVLLLVAITAVFATRASSAYLFTFNICVLAAIGAVGLNVLHGTTGQVSLGSAGFVAAGGFSSVFFLDSGLPFPLDTILAAAVAGVVGVIVGSVGVRLGGLELALATLVAYVIILYFALKYQTAAAPFNGASGFLITPLFDTAGLLRGQRYWAWLLLCVLLLVVLMAYGFMHGKSGRALRLIRDHPVAAPLLGIPSTRYKLLVFFVSSTIFGLVGGLNAHLTGSVITEKYSLVLSIQFVAMIIVGGTDSIAGAIIGATFVSVLPTALPAVLSLIVSEQEAAVRGPQIAQLIYGVLLVIFVVLIPRGIAGAIAAGWQRLASGVSRKADRGSN